MLQTMKLSNATVLSYVLATTSCFLFAGRCNGFGVSPQGVRLHGSSLSGIHARENQLSPISLSSERFSRRLVQTKMVDDDDDDDEISDEGPLTKGVDSVSWLPSVHDTKGVKDLSGTKQDAAVLPLFPLGGIVYTPNSEHVLNIFEPRYRQMYSDILMNGTKRFVVSMSHPTEPGRFAQMGVLFELEQLKEVSEQTADQIKYICNHKVTGRVKLHRILNPEAWDTRDTYLRVEGTIIDDSGKSDDEKDEEIAKKDVYGVVAAVAQANPKEEKALRDAFADLIDLQHELEENVRFTRASVLSLAVKPGSGPDGLWLTIRLWQTFADQRLVARQNELKRNFQEKLQEFLKKEKGLKEEELPSAIGMQDLSPALQREVIELQKRMAVELQPLVLESTLTMQKILEAEDHTERLKLVRHFIEAECKRLKTKKTIKGMFAGSSTGLSADSAIPAEEQVTEQKEAPSPPTQQRSILTDEPDAFQ